jgi:MFS family permease
MSSGSPVVPLATSLENRRLICTILCLTAVALAAASLAPTAPIFLAACLAIGVTSVVAQILVPLAAHLASDANRGRVVGNVMSGLLLGILLARPVSSLIAHGAGWRPVFQLSAGVMLVLALALHPCRANPPHNSYLGLLHLSVLLASVPCCASAPSPCRLFSFSLFGPACLPRRLPSASQRHRLFRAHAGAAGAVIRPGRRTLRRQRLDAAGDGDQHADRRSCLILAGGGGSCRSWWRRRSSSLSVSANMVLSQRAIYGIARRGALPRRLPWLDLLRPAALRWDRLASWSYPFRRPVGPA